MHPQIAQISQMNLRHKDAEVAKTPRSPRTLRNVREEKNRTSEKWQTGHSMALTLAGLSAGLTSAGGEEPEMVEIIFQQR